jgi:hypothetical protein
MKILCSFTDKWKRSLNFISSEKSLVQIYSDFFLCWLCHVNDRAGKFFYWLLADSATLGFVMDLLILKGPLQNR